MDHLHRPIAREGPFTSPLSRRARGELLSQVADYTDDWSSGSETRREAVRRVLE
jgi:hypothetical protein